MTPSEIDLDFFKQALFRLREDLLQTEDSEKEATQPVELDQTMVGRLSRMDALQGQAMAKASQQRRHVLLQRIDSALKRIENGEFGGCLRCGEPIPIKRLEFDPTAPLCVQCADSRGR